MKKKKVSTFKTQTDLRVSLGEDVRVKALGFSGQLEGGLRITQQPNSPAKGTEQLELQPDNMRFMDKN